MENKEYKIGDFTFANDGSKITVSKGSKKIASFSADKANEQINDLVAGLLAINPGENLKFISRSELAERFERSAQAIKGWEKSGLLPGLVHLSEYYIDPQSGIKTHGGFRTAMPVALLPYVELPKRGRGPGHNIPRFTKLENSEEVLENS